MGLPFFDSALGKKRDQVVAVDLGSRTTKAVCLQRRGQGCAITGFALLDAPIYEKTLPPELLSEHLKAVMQVLQPKTKYVSLTVGVNDCQVRHADIPRMPVPDMRQILKLNSRAYLQQDLAGHVFDCHVNPRPQTKPGDKPKDMGGPQKQRVLVAAVRKQLLDDFIQGAKGAGLVPDSIMPGLIGPVNAF
jgi:Tfp pilus assembly PilM family ATPase